MCAKKKWRVVYQSSVNDWSAGVFSGRKNPSLTAAQKMNLWATNVPSNYVVPAIKYSRFALACKKNWEARGYMVQTLADISRAFGTLGSNPHIYAVVIQRKMIAINGSWMESFQEIFRFCLTKKPKHINSLDSVGRLPWIKKADVNKSIGDSFAGNELSVCFDSESDICQKICWLLYVLDYGLSDVVMCFRFPKKKERNKSHAKRRHGKPVVVKRATVFHRADPMIGKYCVNSDGTVVFPSKITESVTDDKKICRSESEAEDTWKGFGIGHPDFDGRFGGLIGEEWAE